MVRPTAPAFSVAPMTATALGRMKTSRSRLGASDRRVEVVSVSVIVFTYRPGGLFYSDADDRARRLTDDGIGIRPQTAEHSIFDASSDHKEVGIVVQRSGAHGERHFIGD